MKKIVDVKVKKHFVIWLKYADGVSGEIDLSSYAKKGVFNIWDDIAVFENVSIGEFGELRWTDEVELCADALYLKLTGQKPEDLFKQLSKESVNA